MREDFDDWNDLKKKIDERQNRPSFFNEGEIWWVNIGQNIGVENNDKDGLFKRPVLVLKKINKYSCIVIPVSTKEKNGPFYYKLYFKKRLQTLMFNQVRVLDVARFNNLVGQIEDKRFLIITEYFISLFKK